MSYGLQPSDYITTFRSVTNAIRAATNDVRRSPCSPFPAPQLIGLWVHPDVHALVSEFVDGRRG